MALVDDIIKRHNAYMSFKTEEGVGTVFEVRFPIYRQNNVKLNLTLVENDTDE
ncbi:MAG: hypothetical protein R3B45_01070 [Bdellovibrionota bacterium]